MKLIELINARKVLSEFAEKEVSVQLAYHIAKFVKATEDDAAYFDKRQQEILIKYALPKEEQKDVEPGQIRIKPECVEQVTSDIRELENIDVEQPNVKGFTLEEFGELKVQPKQMFLLLPLIEDGDTK